LAHEDGDWDIVFGEGDLDRLDTYTIEEKDLSGEFSVIADKYQHDFL